MGKFAFRITARENLGLCDKAHRARMSTACSNHFFRESFKFDMWNLGFVLVNCKLARILLIFFTVMFAASSSSITTNTTTSAKSTKSTASTGTTIPALLVQASTGTASTGTASTGTSPTGSASNGTASTGTASIGTASTGTASTATASTGTTIPALENACDKCLEVIPDDCQWNEEAIPGSKTDFHHGVCPCPGDGTKDKCKVVQRRITDGNIQALQAWSASSLLMAICIAGKIYRIIPYNFYD